MWKQAIVFLMVIGLTVRTAHSFEALSAGIGIDPDEGASIFRIEAQKGLGWSWLESETGYLSFSVDGSLDYWEDGDDQAFAAALAPFLTYYFRPRPIGRLFIEAGIGAGYVSEKQFGNRSLGIHFQFEDILGIGLQLGGQKMHGIRMRFLHYSNAGLDEENDGVTFYTLSYHYLF